MSEPVLSSPLEEALFLDALRLGHRVWLAAHGRSMWPWVRPGARLLIEPPPFVMPPLEPGDLILAHAGGCLRLHRLIELRPEGGLVLKGDAAPRADPLVRPEHVHGRVVVIERGAANRGAVERGEASCAAVDPARAVAVRRPLAAPERALARVLARLSGAQWRLLCAGEFVLKRASGASRLKK